MKKRKKKIKKGANLNPKQIGSERCRKETPKSSLVERIFIIIIAIMSFYLITKNATSGYDNWIGKPIEWIKNDAQPWKR